MENSGVPLLKYTFVNKPFKYIIKLLNPYVLMVKNKFIITLINIAYKEYLIVFSPKK